MGGLLPFSLLGRFDGLLEVLSILCPCDPPACLFGEFVVDEPNDGFGRRGSQKLTREDGVSEYVVCSGSQRLSVLMHVPSIA